MKKLGIVCLALLGALGFTGVAYGAWSDTLNITATAVTGTFDVRFGQAESNDPGTEADPAGAGAWSFDGTNLTWSGPVTADKASTEVNPGVLTLDINITDAYVGYASSVGCTLVNSGSVPVKVDEVRYQLSLPQDRDASDVEISFSGALLAGSYIDVGRQAAGAVNIRWNGVPVLSSTYFLTVSITVSQWNAVD
jgi:hypothetical protein